MAVQEQVKHAIDGGAAAAVLSSLAGWLPPIAAALGIIWYCVQIAESKTGQRVIGRVRAWLRSIRSLPPDPPAPSDDA